MFELTGLVVKGSAHFFFSVFSLFSDVQIERAVDNIGITHRENQEVDFNFWPDGPTNVIFAKINSELKNDSKDGSFIGFEYKIILTARLTTLPVGLKLQTSSKSAFLMKPYRVFVKIVKQFVTYDQIAGKSPV